MKYIFILNYKVYADEIKFRCLVSEDNMIVFFLAPLNQCMYSYILIVITEQYDTSIITNLMLIL